MNTRDKIEYAVNTCFGEAPTNWLANEIEKIIEAERKKMCEATPPWLLAESVRLTAEVEQLTEQLRISRGRQNAANNGAKKMYAKWIARGQRIYELENEVKMLKAESHSSGVAEIDKASADTIASLRLHLNEMIDESLGLERKINMLKDEVKRLKSD